MNWKFFSVGFFLGIAFFVGINIYSYQAAVPPCCDFTTTFGFPFPLGITGGFAGETNLVLLGLFANIGVAVVTSGVFGWVVKKSLPPVINLFRGFAQWHLKTRS